jgi:hypothetical protein
MGDRARLVNGLFKQGCESRDRFRCRGVRGVQPFSQRF